MPENKPYVLNYTTPFAEKANEAIQQGVSEEDLRSVAKTTEQREDVESVISTHQGPPEPEYLSEQVDDDYLVDPKPEQQVFIPPPPEDELVESASHTIAASMPTPLQQEELVSLAADLKASNPSGLLDEFVRDVLTMAEDDLQTVAAQSVGAGELTPQEGVDVVSSSPRQSIDVLAYEAGTDKLLSTLPNAQLKTLDELTSISIQETDLYKDELELYDELIRREEFGFGGPLDNTVLDFVGLAFPFNEAEHTVAMGNFLAEEFGADFKSHWVSFLALGEGKQGIIEWINGLDSDTAVDVMERLLQNATEEDFSITDGNAVVFNSLIQTMFKERRQLFVDGDVPVERYIDTAFSLLDMVGLGGTVKTAFKLTKDVRGLAHIKINPLHGVNPTSNMSRVARIDPEEGKNLVGAVMADTSGSTAAKAGTTREDVFLESTVKNDPHASLPQYSSEAMARAEAKAQRVIDQKKSNQYNYLEEEKNAQAAKLKKDFDSVKPGHHWTNGSVVEHVDGGVSVSSRWGKSEDTPFTLNEAKAFIGYMAARVGDAPWRIVRREPDNTITHIEGRQIKTEQDVLDEVKAYLAESSAVKLSPEELAVKVTEKKRATAELKQAEKKVATLNSPKGKTKEQKTSVENDIAELMAQGKTAQEARAILSNTYQAEVNSISQYIDEINELTKNTTGSGQVLNNQARFDAGDYKSLTGEAREIYAKGMRQVKTDTATLEDASYFVEYKFTSEYDNSAIPALRKGSVQALPLNLTNWGMDASAVFSKELASLANTLGDRAKFAEKELLGVLEPFVKAPDKIKRLAHSFIEEGASLERNFTVSELKSKLPETLSTAEMKATMDAYYAVRRLADTAHGILGTRLGEKLRSQGKVYINTEGVEDIGKVLSPESSKRVSQVFDPSLGDSRLISVEEMQKVLDEGGSVVRVDSPLGEELLSRHILVKDNTALGQIPDNPLKYIPGYVPKFRDNLYYIQGKKTRVVDGVKETFPVVINAARNKKEALSATKILKSRTAQGESLGRHGKVDDIEYRIGKEELNANVVDAELELAKQQGRMFFSKRREDELTDITGDPIGVVSPIEALSRLAASTSKAVEQTGGIELMKQRWLATYGHKFAPNGVFPSSVGQIEAKVASSAEANQAKAMFERIQFMSGDYVVSHAWRKYMTELGEWMESSNFLGVSSLGKQVRTKLSQKDLAVRLRQIAFYTQIVTNPARQLALQGLQALTLLPLDPAYGLKAFADGGTLLSSQLSKGIESMTDINLAKVEKLNAKVMNMTVEEYRATVKRFEDTGLTQAMDTSLIGREAAVRISNELTASTLGGLARKGMNIAKIPFIASKTLGFDFGEMINISATYMMAQRRYLKANPKLKILDLDSPVHARAIHADARNLALSMTRESGFKYQSGMLSPMLQYYQVMHKAALQNAAVFLPTNRSFTRKDAATLAIGNVLLLGPDSIGLGAIVDEALNHFGLAEQDSMLRDLLVGGAFDALGNAILDLTTEDGGSVELSESLVLGGGPAMLANLVRTIATGEDERGVAKTILQVAGGASYSGVSKIGSFIQDLGRTYIVSDWDKISDPAVRDATKEQWREQNYEQLLSIFSGANNMIKAHLMLRTGKWVSKDDRVLEGVDVTSGEAVMYGLFGTVPKAVVDQYKQMSDTKKRQTIASEMGAFYYSRVTAYDEAATTFDERFIQESANLDVVKNMIASEYEDDPELLEMIVNNVQNRIKTEADRRKTTPLQMQLERVLKTTPNPEARLGEMLRTKQITTEDYQKALELMEDLTTINNAIKGTNQ